MDISTQLDSIKNDKSVNSVRASVAQAIQRLGKGKLDIDDDLSEIRTAIYGPVIREAVLRSSVQLLNYRRVDGGDVRAALFNVATQEYGRDLREPLIDILEKIAGAVPDYEIDIGPEAYEISNCLFDASTGVVTPEDPGSGFGGTVMIPNVIESTNDTTVAVVSKTGQTLYWCVLLYDENENYLHDDTVDQGLHYWKRPGARIDADFSNARYLRFFIRSEESGLDLDTIEAPYGAPEERLKAGVQLFNREVNT